MRASQLYRYLFLAQTTEETNFFVEACKKIKSEDEFRSVLRVLKAADMEKSLYGNTTDHLVWASYFSEYDFAKEFKNYNNRYKYLANTPENIELYRQIYYLCQILWMCQQGSYRSFLSGVQEYVFQIIVYFGSDGSAENTLQKFDEYCNANKLLEKPFSEIFPLKLRGLNSPISLPAWQKIILRDNSPEAIAMFQIAPELEKFLGRSPLSLEEAKEISGILLIERTWTHQELFDLVSRAPFASSQDVFIETMNEKNVQELIQDYGHFCKILPLIKNPEPQKKLLARIGAETLRSFAMDEYRCIAMLRSVHRNNLAGLLHNLGTDIVLQNIKSAYSLSYFIKNDLPASYDQALFIKSLSKEKLHSYLQNFFDLQYLLPFVKQTERLDFLLNVIGKEKCAACLNASCFINEILDDLRVEDRLPFIKELFKPEDLKLLYKDKRHWQDLKFKLQKEDRNFLREFNYSQEDLSAKGILKNIKHTIQKTKWSIGMFDRKHVTNLGRREVEVPDAVYKQVSEFHSRSFGRKSYPDALKEIKKIGKEAALQSKPWGITGFFISESETQKYFKHYETEEAFNEKFNNQN